MDTIFREWPSAQQRSTLVGGYYPKGVMFEQWPNPQQRSTLVVGYLVS